MFRLSFIIILLAGFLFVSNSNAQSPHGEGLKLDCSVCHNPNNWKVDIKKTKFDHSTTGFKLIGQHNAINCQSCHEDLVFTNAEPECLSCHTDIHQETVGLDCARCHTPVSWQVKDINGLHQQSRFPLVGTHQNADCVQCHSRYTDLYFEPLDVDCFSCHESDYNSTQSPNHTEAGFPTDCKQCHSLTAADWAARSIIHDFFPLVGGHAIQDCFLCHQQGGNFTGLSQECYSCHQQDYENVQDPNHLDAGFPTDCTQCHTITAWSPASFDHNQTNFPLTGKHTTVDCSSCHTNGFAGTPTDCYSCHQQDYENVQDPNHIANNFPTDCNLCHNTNGWDEATFDHNQTNFPLTGAHITVDCQSCHANGYQGTPTDCYSCHQQDYENVQDPNHVASNFPTDCTQCHSTDSWSGADFDHSQTGFELTGAHLNADCVSCHASGFEGTPTDCFSCHEADYNNSSNPDHIAANFPTTCEDCHSTSAWTPATFDHDGQYFPIYSGKHKNKWDNCIECHTVPSDYSQFSCIDCHEHRQSKMDDEHQGVDGYVYESNACLSCHPTGDSDGAFNHGDSDFPLTGTHNGLDCLACHQNGYQNTPTQCVACHQQNYDSSTNPDHQALSLPTDCESCHSTNPDWKPASFPVHNQFFPLEGAHQQISNDCATCHNGDYNNTPDQCFGCHESDYNNAPDHMAQNYPTDCDLCHNVNNWEENSFDHSNTDFPLTGAHQNVDCSACHENGYTGTSTVCYDCHQTNYEQTSNPDHQALNLPTSCEDCHTTNPNWEPATFPIHNQFYELVGAHANISDQCNDCHNGDYNNTPNTCFGCHESEYNGVNDPPHQALNFSHDCLDCHNQNNWEPANFNHDFFPLSNEHTDKNCNECHSEPNYGPQCLSCHEEDFLDEHDWGDPTDCWSCHTTFDWDDGGGMMKPKRVE